jgi:3',5'-cyclic-AMP phosphodiesterase
VTGPDRDATGPGPTDPRPEAAGPETAGPETAGPEGMSRRQLIRHGAWFGAAVVLTVAGGEVISHVGGSAPAAALAQDPHALRFVQLSDSHIGFHGPANLDVTGSFTRAITEVNGLGYRPDFVMHTGDLTHLSTPAQFDQVQQMLHGLDTGRVFTVPGEHDSVGDHGQQYRARFGAGSKGDGWYSFDIKGVHVIALVNTLALEKLGHLGTDQLDFVRRDVAGLSSDTPIVVFSHIPLFAMYPAWGWGTDDSAQALSYLRRFSSVTCLNGHVHQLFTKTEGNVTFYSATTTAYPLPKPGQGPAPTPQVLPAGQLGAALGIRQVSYRTGQHDLALKDQRLT